MINPEKTRLKTRIALLEQGSRAEQLSLKTYFEEKPIRFRLQNLACGAGIYMIVVFVALVIAGDGITYLAELPAVFALVIIAAAGLGVLFTLLYANITGKILKKRYRDTRSSLVKYDLLKNKINEG